MKDRINWQKKEYPHFWEQQVVRYGFDDYCKGLFQLIEKKDPKSVYELAIGTGWPFAISFYEKGIKVSGSDISDHLIKKINEDFPGIASTCTSYENVRIDEKFDVVYCFRSTWYFPDVLKALELMLSLCKEGGYVVFDIMNADSDYIKRIVGRHRLFFPITIGKNIIKWLGNTFFKKKYLIQDPWNIHELPVSPLIIDNFLKSRGVVFRKYSINQIVDMSQPFCCKGEPGSKVVYECQVS